MTVVLGGPHTVGGAGAIDAPAMMVATRWCPDLRARVKTGMRDLIQYINQLRRA